MSLTFNLYINNEEVFSRNITHNLGTMATAAGIYQVLWSPEELGFKHAEQCIEFLSNGLTQLITHRKKYEEFNSENGWGMYSNFVHFVEAVLIACHKFPAATINVSR